MPYCELKSTVKLTGKQKEDLGHALAGVIELIPGKSEHWVMATLEDDVDMMFAGTNESPCALLTVKTFGELTNEQYDMLSKQFCEVLQNTTGVPTDRIYVIYEPILHWGWNNENF